MPKPVKAVSQIRFVGNAGNGCNSVWSKPIRQQEYAVLYEHTVSRRLPLPFRLNKKGQKPSLPPIKVCRR